jgi:Cu-Zn family superoxide dismutase
MRQEKWWGWAGVLLACATLSACGVFGPHERRAEVILAPASGSSVQGRAELIERAEGVQVTYNVMGFAPNTDHSFVIHTGGTCRMANRGDVAALGPRFKPFDADVHLSARARRDESLGRVSADGNGTAMGFFLLPGMTLDGVGSVVGRTLAVHAGVDAAGGADASAGPGTNLAEEVAGRVLACGVISR